MQDEKETSVSRRPPPRSSLLKAAKKALKYYKDSDLNQWRAQPSPGISKETYTALFGRPEDFELKTLVKNGA
jgi:hypothetical protein